MITTKTSDLLIRRAQEFNAIAEAIDEAGFHDEAERLVQAARHAAAVGSSIEGKIAAYAAAAVRPGEPSA